MTSHRRFHLFGNLLHFHRFSDETQGRYAMVEAVVAPGAGAPVNRHPQEDEAFVVLDGEFEFVIDGETHRATRGDVMPIPGGAKHGFTNVGDRPGRVIIFNSPGDTHVAFFTQAGDPVSEDGWDFPEAGPPDMPRVMAAAAAAGVEIFPPNA